MKRNRMEIRAAIIENLQTAGWPVDDLRVEPDPFTGWLIVVVSWGFDGKSREERKKIVLAGLDELHIEWLEMLTPVEVQSAGPWPTDFDLEALPLWPEALARGRLANDTPPGILFSSDLNQDIKLPIVTTFYSWRGGVGRSTALAYTSRILAARGWKVVCVDMDLEAPGLAGLFGREQDVEEGYDLIHLLLAFDQGSEPDLSKYLLRISESDDLYCLPAGRSDANHARLLQFIHTEGWYREEPNPLRLLIEHLNSKLPFTPDVILLDAGRGLMPLNGPLLFDLADLCVMVFFPHAQIKRGMEALVRGLLAARTRRQLEGLPLTPEPRFLLSPLPASKASHYKQLGLDWIAQWLNILKEQADELKESELTHFVPYREIIATSDFILSDRKVWRDYEPVAEWIERFFADERNLNF